MKIVSLLLGMVCCLIGHSQSIDPVSLLLAKAIKTIDIKVQRLQNETLVLQRLQQAAEQELSKTQLAEIKKWESQLVQLYDDYFRELGQVKEVIGRGSTTQQVKKMYQQLLGLSVKIHVADQVVSDALLQKGKAAYQSLLVVTRDGMAMTDAERLAAMQVVETVMRQCVSGLAAIQEKRQKVLADAQQRKLNIQQAKKLYGIQ